MPLPNNGMTETAIREWLLNYAWLDEPAADEEARIDCIMAQGGWKHADAVADKFAGAQDEPGGDAWVRGVEFALSALYECHTGPHQPGCKAW